MLINELVSEVSIEVTGSFILFYCSKSMVEILDFNLIIVNSFFIHGKFLIIKNWKISVRKKRVNCNLWPGGTKSIYTKWITGPEPVTLPSKPCNRINRIRGMERILCCCAYFLSINISPITPVSNKVMGSSDNSLNLIVHRETRCLLFEVFTEFVGVKIKTKIKKRDSFCKRLNAKFKPFFVAVLQKEFQWQTESLLITSQWELI